MTRPNPPKAVLEHVNITVSDPAKTAEMARQLFGWHIRWEGPSMDGAGYTIHVGTDDSYVAVYSQGSPKAAGISRYDQKAGLNHVGIVVDDIDATEAAVREFGITPHNHADYEPGRRFYFEDHDGVEWEVVSYS